MRDTPYANPDAPGTGNAGKTEPDPGVLNLESELYSRGLLNINPEQDSKTRQFSKNALQSFKYSLVQVPLDGAAQLADQVLDSDLRSRVRLIEPPKPETYGSAGWHGQVVGSTLGAAAQLAILYRFMGPGAGAKLELTNSYKIGRAAMPTLGKSALTGAIYSGVFQPVDDSENFIAARLRNGATGFATGMTLTSSSIALKSAGSRLLANDIVSGALSGVPTGIVSANTHALLSEGRLANADQVKETTATYVIGGALMGTANKGWEALKPTSGIRGVRTLTDMTRHADATRVSNYEQIAKDVNLPPRNHAKLFRDTVSSLKGSTLTAEEKVLIARGHRDLVDSFEQLKPNGPTVTIYGSARLPEDSFAYQRTRYTAGKLARNGWSVMTGGGEHGIMRAANQGAFEAGGRSIGVNVELPFEQKPNPFQTVQVEHKNFFTRKETLRKSDAFIIEEGGIGTLDEAMEVLTLAQTGKIKSRPPIYFVGRETYAPIEAMLQTMLKHKTISAKDMSLFRIVDDPNVIINDLGTGTSRR